MNLERWNVRLATDESLTDNLTDDEAGALLAWAEATLERCSSDDEARRVVERVAAVNRAVGAGAGFEELMSAMRSMSGPDESRTSSSYDSAGADSPHNSRQDDGAEQDDAEDP